MNSHHVLATVMAFLLVWSANAHAQQTAEELYQAGLYQEEVKGDLERAIQLYRDIVERHGDARPVAAKALLQLGRCYEKLGRTEATNAYQRLLNDYADQSQAAAEARARLAAIQRAVRASEEVGITARQIWSGPNAGAYDVTPDGKYFVVGAGNLAVREVATGRSRFFTQDARESSPWANPYAARVSGDGKWVAYGYSEQDQGGSLRIVGIDGNNLRELLAERGCWVHPYGWTSDRNQIATRLACWSEANPEGTFKIVLVSVADGSVQVVRELSSSRYGLRSWLSPDDRYLVYDGPVEQDEGNFDIWLLPLDGSEQVDLIKHPAKDHLLGWVPGTDQVLFISDRDGTWDLWTIPVTAGVIGEAPHKIQRDMGEVSTVGFSESGSLFYEVFTRWFTTSIAPFDLATGTADLEAASPLLGSNRSPHWSPDGQHLAFVAESPSLTSGKLGTLNIRNLATGQQRRLATHLGVRFVGDWSPDGRSILAFAWDKARPGDSGALYSVDVASGGTTALVPFSEGFGLQGIRAEWSTDGEAIIYCVRSANPPLGRLVRRELDLGEERELYRDSLLVWQALEVSPNGRQLVFAFEDTLNAVGGGGLAVLELETGATRPIVAHGDSVYGDRGNVQWTPDGRYVVYGEIVHGDEWRTLVSRVPVAGGDPEYLWTFAEGKYGGWFELSPDGRQIALTTYTQETEIWVMENLREVLEREPQSALGKLDRSR